MRSRFKILVLLGLLVLAGAWLFWSSGQRAAVRKHETAVRQAAIAPSSTSMRPGSTAPQLFATGKTGTNSPAASARTNQFAWRLNNTSKTLSQLMKDPHGILLENAFIDTDAKLNLAIPPNLKASGDPGAYIVQSRGPVDNAFRARLAAAGAGIVSYVPNNAYLVTMSAGGAAALAGQSGVQAVLPYEPYYKLPASLMPYAGKSFPADRQLRVAAYPNTADAVRTWLENSGPNGPQILAEQPSPFGATFIVQNVTDVAALVQQPVIGRVEPVFRRVAANDLARVALGISTNTVTSANFNGLSGSNVVVEVNDTGIDALHPDFSLTGSAGSGASGPTRVFGQPGSLVDVNGHGTHVAGIIAGNGSESYSVTNTPQGSVTNADFRGKAPAAKLYSFMALDDSGLLNISDYELQSTPALTNVLISNNSWNYSGDNSYDLAAASYDAAVRDALPFVTGSQPVLFVFSAGNVLPENPPNDDGTGGEPDTILSPATAKNVITVGALEQDRGITNTYTPLDTTNEVAPWTAGTDSSFQVADYSARGNVGIGSEGDFGRFKPDVVAPGSFVVSTRSAQWDTTAYYNPSNYYFNVRSDQIVNGNSLRYYSFPVPGNAVAVKITLTSNGILPFPTNMLIYVKQSDYPDKTTYDFVTSNNRVSIPPDGGAGYLTTILTNGFFFTVGNPTNVNVSYNIITEYITTNDNGNYYEVLSNLNDTLAPFYRYESGTSMSAPAVSGSLALFQDYFTNTLHSTPSPALLKSLLINGARKVGNYNFVVTNGINFQGWGEPSVPNSMPYGLTNALNAVCSSFFLDQSPTNALATGASQPYQVTVTNTTAESQPLRVTLAWTDPPGNPSVAIKLVNNLDLMVSNNVTGEVYFGNDIPRDSVFNAAWDTNGPPNLDFVNNVENVFLETAAGGSFTVTVIGRSVNVNAVTAQTNNVVQDYALVISSGDGLVTNALTVALNPAPVLAGPLVTFVANTNTLLMNQLAGGNTPLLGTNTVGVGAGYATNAAVTLGMTNQWHFYVVTNKTGFTNAAFISILSQTLAIPRMGVFATDRQFPTQPEGDLDMYVASLSTDPNAYTLTNLNPVVISNCVHGLSGDAASLGNGTGTEFVAYSNSVPDGVYYIGIKSETQEAVQYDFLPVFSEQPFSQTDSNGNEVVNGLLLPVNIPDGDNAHPGVAYIFALAAQPIQVQDVIITNQVDHQNYGDLVGDFSHGGRSVVLNNHNSTPPPGLNTYIYDESPAPIPGSQVPDGPGSLLNFQGQQGIGPWILTEVDDSQTQTGAVTGLTILIKPHLDLGNQGVHVSIAPNSWFYGYIDVPPGATNLTLAATNVLSVPGSPSLQMFERLGNYPTTSNYDKTVTLTNGTPPGGLISIGPSDVPPIQPGRYYVGIYNGSGTFYNDVFVIARIALGQAETLPFSAAGPTNLLDDAVMYSSVFVTNTLPIATVSVGLRVEHPRISDLVFHLISPDGTRYLLMENRGGTSTNGCGLTAININDFAPVSSSGGPEPQTNIVNVGQTSGTVAIDYDFFTAPDEMTVYYQGALEFDSGLTNGNGTFRIPYGPGTSTDLTIIMNEFGNSQTNTAWNYTIHSIQTNYYYLTLTQDTNLTTTPIKFAPPPFVPSSTVTTNISTASVMQDGFDGSIGGEYPAPGFIPNTGWQITGGNVDILNPSNTLPEFLADSPPNCLDLNGSTAGTIVTNFNTISGQQYILSFAYTKNASPANPGYPYFVASAQISITGLTPFTLSTPPTFTNSYFSLNWMHTNIIFTATGPTTTLQFASLNSGDGGMFLDSVSVDKLVWYNSFEGGINNSIPSAGQYFAKGWYVNSGSVDWLSSGTFGSTPYEGNWYIDLDGEAQGTISTNIPTIVGGKYLLSFAYSKNSGIGDGNYPSASVLINGSSALVFSAVVNNTWTDLKWATTSLVFTATSTLTPLQFHSLTPNTYGVLLDAVGLELLSNTNTMTSSSDLYYLPEQSLDPLVGSSPYGLWQLEIQDDRVGATNNTILDSWQMQFVFADTNPVPANAGGGVTNFVPPGGTFWIEVDVPTNADFATNILTFATGPLNMWYSTNTPPTTINPPGDVQLLTGATNGAPTLGTNGSPINATSAYIVPGGIYYIGLQNLGAVTVNFGFRVDFHLLGPIGVGPYAFTEPPTRVTGASAQLNGMATANGFPANAWFQWGTSQNYGNTTPPVPVGAGSNVVFVTSNITGLVTNFAFHYRLVVSNLFGVTYGFDQIIDQGNLVAWGADFKGQTTPIPAGLTNLVVGVGAGYDYSLALNYNGTVVAWGNNSQGQTNVPVNLSNAVAVAGGVVDSLALRSDRTVTVWGSNLYGQTNVPPNLTNAVAVASGSEHCLALRDTGNPVAWGSDVGTNVPAGLSNVVAVAAGEFHSLALINDGTVVAWGNNAEGETNVPSGLTNVVAIAAGYSHNLALRYDGTVVAWGFNGNGQTNVPFGLTNVMAIAAGGYHCLAVKTDGSVVFWGDSSSGQTNFTPVNLTNVFTIAGGGLHTVAVSALAGLSVTNTPPYWTNGLDSTTITMDILTTKVINNSALDSNAPPQLVFYSFANNPPSFASIDALTGLITLSPQAADGPSTNIIATVATDNGYPPLSATNSFTLIVTSTNTPPQTNAIPIGGIIYTNIGGTNGFLLTWFAPSNDLFQVQWSDGLGSPWNTFTNIISYDTNYPAGSTNATFTFFDDGSQTGGFGPTRFYRLILLGSGSNSPPVLPSQATRTIDPLNPLVVTNTATDADVPPQTLSYVLTSTVTGANVPVISTNGIITWTPDVSQAGSSNVITTIVTDSGTPNLSTTNSFSVIVNPIPSISSVTYSNGGFLLTWWAPTNDIFQVQFSDGLSPVNWQSFSNLIAYTGPVTPTNGLFSFFDDGSEYPFSGLRFYRLILVGITMPPNTPPVLPSQATRTIDPLNPLVVINNATDADVPLQSLTYMLTSTVTGANVPVIDTNGIITWTPDVSQAGSSNVITTIVTDSGVPPLSATNSFSVLVNPVPSISSVTYSNGGFLLTWWAPTNDIFQVEVATNLASPTIWLTFTNIITYTGPVTPTNGLFSFYDDGSQIPFATLRFYRLKLIGVAPATMTTVPIGSIISTNGGFLLTWSAPTNDQFNVRWATNITPPITWTLFPGTVTSTNGIFSFMDTNTTLLMKFYDLILLP